ncbi:uncharacterized protein BYT42DRAFT_499278 [Radiomyces spectabilis]|uniref:uncharacterized protein n=1 Tax=Radiomyces spectabilis TaxID=64574 RepID=UPI00221F6D71|nr:uncharacterized protein BYT42DRAFT_499278 [Radiomyces spectabilis]KAI8374638.1 hypothetical protein BYT42DRAFT_499278 [Radiomyces spectabilis]
MPFMRDASVCYTFDMRTQQWDCHPIKLVNIDRPNPLITCASAIGDNIYLIGGRRLHSYTLSNAMLILNIKDFTLRLVEDATGYAPRPRHEHTVDAVQGRYLVMFGGLCYNSIGENDVFVYDTFENRWFLPQIRGPIPHLRFGHASTVNGTDLYIYGGAQIGNDDGYVMFNDLYKLDCNTWTWYKYEHPDVEKYMRQEIGPAKTDDWEETKDHNSIFTAGFGPTDRFQACMFAYKNKLIVFGGLTIRHDEDDNEYMWNYSLDEICVFNPRLRLWTTMDGNCHGLPVVLSDMSTALISHGCGGFYVYVIGGRKKESEEKRMRMVHDTSTLTEKREISMSIDEAVPKQYIGDDAPLLPSSNSGTRRGSAVSRWKGKALITSTGKAGGVDTYDANFNSDPASRSSYFINTTS